MIARETKKENMDSLDALVIDRTKKKMTIMGFPGTLRSFKLLGSSTAGAWSRFRSFRDFHVANVEIGGSNDKVGPKSQAISVVK